MIKFFSTYYQRLTALILVLSIVPILLLSIYLYVDKINVETNSLNSRLISISEIGANSISEEILQRKQFVGTVAHSPMVIGNTKELMVNTEDENFSARLELMKQFYNDIHNYDWLDKVYILDKETGMIVFHTSMFEMSTSWKNEKCFNEALKKIICAGDIEPSHTPVKNEFGAYEKIPILMIYSPILGEAALEGVLMVHTDIFDLVPEMGSYIGDFQYADSYLVNSNGYFLSKPVLSGQFKDPVKKRPELELRLITPQNEPTKIFQIRDDLKSKSNIEGYVNYAGKQVVGAISPVDDTGWFYVVEISRDEAYEGINVIQRTILISILSITAVIVGVSFAFARRLTSPIKKMKEAVSSMAQGKFKEIKIESSDEFGELGKEYNSMAKSLDESIIKLETLERKYRTLYETSPEMYRTVDENGCILDANTAYVKALGYSKEEIVGKTIFEHTAEKSLENIHESFSTWKNMGIVQNKEVWLKRKDGTIFPTLLSASSLYDKDGKIVGSNTVLKDMTDIYHTKKELEEVKIKRLMAIGELAARVAHDLRNPLSVIKNTVQIMKLRNKEDVKTNEYLEKLDRSVGRMTHQIDEVLDYVSPKSLNLQTHSLVKILNEVTSRITKSDTITINLPTNDIEVVCDSEKLEVVFVNLILNAIQAMENKGIISIRLAESVDKIIIEIEDTGPGISEDTLSKIFEPLFTTRQVGTGLGLPSCKSVVERHGGTIDVKTAVGKGTTFIIQLPKIKQ